jgi:LmbE family N-acetylglucosaminyl deacetylase
VKKNEADTVEVARRLGLQEAIFLNYPNHNMDGWPLLEMRARLIFLFRALKVDTVLVYDPSALYERNPDHYVTARAVESACWMAGSEWDYPEHFRAGLRPHSVKDKYYFGRGPQLVNRVVDITPYMEKKVWANLANVTQGPAGNHGAALRKRLAEKKLKLPLLGDDDETANRQYTKEFALVRDRTRGRAHGLEYAEYFHYIPPDQSDVESYISKNAVPL